MTTKRLQDCGHRPKARPASAGGGPGCCARCDRIRSSRRRRELEDPTLAERRRARQREANKRNRSEPEYVQRERESNAERMRRYAEDPKWRRRKYERDRARLRQMDPEVRAARYRHKAATPRGRASSLTWGARQRAREAGIEFALSRAWVLEKLRVGVCERTGIEFDFENEARGKLRSPCAPSLDRIDPHGGYTPENVQVVVWAYNLAKGSWGGDAVEHLARALIARVDGLPLFAPASWRREGRR